MKARTSSAAAGETGVGAARLPVRLVSFAWGQRYVDRLLDYALSSALAPGNLPALVDEFDCTVVIVTEEKLFDYVRSHPVGQRLADLCDLKLVSLDDLIGEPWQYGITLAYALFRGFEDLGPAMTDTYILFLCADFILADGCYERLKPRIRSGEKAVHLSPSYCTVEERVSSLLEARRDPVTGALVAAPRDMAGMILEHRHNTIRAKTVNQSLYSFEYMDQFYWEVDRHTLLAHQMPIAMVGMRPEVALADIGAFWDWGIVYDFCPSRNLTVLGDSDEFLMLELREDKTHLDLVRMGWSSPQDMASRMRGYITEYQVNNARFPLTLHARDLPPGTAEAHASLQAFTEEVLRHLPSTPIDHRGHEQWAYHRRHLAEHRRVRTAADVQAVRAIDVLRREITDAYAQALENIDVQAPELEQLRARLDLQTRYELKLRQLDVEEAKLAEAREKRRQLARVRAALTDGAPLTVPAQAGTLQRAYNRLFGHVPDTRVWHPLHTQYRQVSALIREAAAHAPTRTLLLSAIPDAKLLRAVQALPGAYVHMEQSHFPRGAALKEIADVPPFDLCVIDLDVGDLGIAAELCDAVAPILTRDARIIVHWVNRRALPPESWGRGLMRAMLLRDAQISVRHSGSWAGAQAARVLHRAADLGAGRGLPARAALFACGLAASAPLAAIAHWVERRRDGTAASSAHPSPCTSITLELRRTPDKAPVVEPESFDRPVPARAARPIEPARAPLTPAEA